LLTVARRVRAIAFVNVNVVPWREHRTRSSSGTDLQAVRLVAVALNVVAAPLELNAEVMSQPTSDVCANGNSLRSVDPASTAPDNR
jgi:hypothetical protein